MSDYWVIVCVVLVVIWAHVWLFIWIKFKVDEGVITKVLEKSDIKVGVSTDYLAQHAKLNNHRVEKICTKSPLIIPTQHQNALWCLISK